MRFDIRPMKPGEIDLALEWAAAEGWIPGLHDGPAFYATDPKGFLVGVLDGEPIACICVVAYDSTFGFLGFHIVKPETRGKGFGLQIWNAGMHYLGDRNVGLDGVPDQQDNYRKSGFALAYSNVRYEGRTIAASDQQAPGIVALGPEHLPQVRQSTTPSSPRPEMTS
jgi:Acetyltransferase (GNAT) family